MKFVWQDYLEWCITHGKKECRAESLAEFKMLVEQSSKERQHGSKDVRD